MAAGYLFAGQGRRHHVRERAAAVAGGETGADGVVILRPAACRRRPAPPRDREVSART
jgi:hypothetical protein